MSKRDYNILLEDIIESIDKIKKYTYQMTYDEFVIDTKTVDAVIRNLEIIGEAANKIPDIIQEEYNIIEWYKIIGLRNRIIHEYFGIDYRIIWEIIQSYLDKLKQQVQKII